MAEEVGSGSIYKPDVYKLRITHYSDEDFLDVFRADLSTCIGRAVILSPFLSQNRAISYYPVLLTLAARNVTVEIYAKPQREQPESLRDHFVRVKEGLQRTGARFFTRPGMHEKVGIIDGSVLWHGSLNILSHNDTRESMLRFESPELVQEVLLDLELIPDGGKEATGYAHQIDTDVAIDSPLCPQCHGQMRAYEAVGLWICRTSPECRGTLPLNQGADELRTKEISKDQRIEISCPVCASPMIISRGVFLRVECSSHDCGFALDPRIAASLLRMLRRKGVVA